MALSSTAISCARRPRESMAPLLIKRFEHALVQQAQVDVLAEFENRFEAPKLLARGDDRLNRVAADILHRCQPEANGVRRAE